MKTLELRHSNLFNYTYNDRKKYPLYHFRLYTYIGICNCISEKEAQKQLTISQSVVIEINLFVAQSLNVYFYIYTHAIDYFHYNMSNEISMYIGLFGRLCI